MVPKNSRHVNISELNKLYNPGSCDSGTYSRGERRACKMSQGGSRCYKVVEKLLFMTKITIIFHVLSIMCTSSIPSSFIQITALVLSHQRYRSSRGVIECGDENLVGRCVCLGDQGRTLGRWDQVVLEVLSLLLTLIYVFCKYFKGLSYQGCGQCLHVLRGGNCKSSLLWRGWGDRAWFCTCPIINVPYMYIKDPNNGPNVPNMSGSRSDLFIF